MNQGNFKQCGSAKGSVGFDMMFEQWWSSAPPNIIPDVNDPAHEHVKLIAKGAMMTAVDWASCQSANVIVDTCQKLRIPPPDSDDENSASLTE